MNILQTATTKLGNKIELIGEASENNILVIGVFHGDEPQGKYLIERYLEQFSPSPFPSPQGGEGLQHFHAHNYTVFSKIKSKELRQNSTDSEKKLWSILRNNQIHNLHFKRQKPIGKYIIDFVCLKEKIIIELDGGQHNIPENIQKDKERTAYLNSLGFLVIRIWNNEITENFEGVKEYLYNSLAPLGRGLGRGENQCSFPLVSEELGRGANNLLLIPCLNPDGMQNNTRTNANGVDLNRNFPTKNWGEDTSAAGDNPQDYYGGKSAGSEIETQFVIDIIEKYQPKLILTLHAPYKIVNYDGPAQNIAQKISDIIGYPVEPSIGYPTPGSFGTYCGVERNIPTITLELDEKIPVETLEQPVFEIFDMLQN